MIYTYPFTQEEAAAAYDEWHCNCGPAALAFALQVPLNRVRSAIPGFDKKHYASPSMMAAAIDSLGAQISDMRPSSAGAMFCERIALVRVQWTGPWFGKLAYHRTHWIASWQQHHGIPVTPDQHTSGEADKDGRLAVFDVNGGIQTFGRWKSETVPAITKSIIRADGGWYATHIWQILE